MSAFPSLRAPWCRAVASRSVLEVVREQAACLMSLANPMETLLLLLFSDSNELPTLTQENQRTTHIAG